VADSVLVESLAFEEAFGLEVHPYKRARVKNNVTNKIGGRFCVFNNAFMV